ncbi:hypothetical protein SBA2_120025 [Acidobacteriia bacterium SbA2]|nr:hypothetical protein SBA2_120025 [Acidobacteriia bacterium SbA2]
MISNAAHRATLAFKWWVTAGSGKNGSGGASRVVSAPFGPAGQRAKKRLTDCIATVQAPKATTAICAR